MLPADLNPDDVLCSHNMGAYSIVTACGFNGFGRINSYLGNPGQVEKQAPIFATETRQSLRKIINRQ